METEGRSPLRLACPSVPSVRALERHTVPPVDVATSLTLSSAETVSRTLTLDMPRCPLGLGSVSVRVPRKTAATAWLDEAHFAPAPTAAYGIVLLMAAIAYWILQGLIIRSQGEGSLLKRAVGTDWKGKASPWLYALAIGLSFRFPGASLAIYALVALIWLVPDRRIERVIGA